MYKPYQTLIEKKQGRKVNEAIEKARDWWKSLDASQKEAGFATWKYQVTPAVFIRVPVPFTGCVDVVYVGMAGKSAERKTPKPEQLAWLRSIVRNPPGENWRVFRKPDGVTMLWKPDVLTTGEPDRLGDLSYGFITLA